MRLGVFRLPGYIVYDRRVRDSLYSSGITDPGRYIGYGSSNTKTLNLRVLLSFFTPFVLARMHLGVFRLPGYIDYDRRVRDSLYSSGITDPGRYTGYGSSNTKATINENFLPYHDSELASPSFFFTPFVLARMRLGVFRLPGYIVYDRRVRDSLYSSGITDPGRYIGYGSSNTK
ncbi:hypothetical protein NDU88_005310 [Pleurodeles waltl]|uniref:Uncharacterized protein n=1 Tax=Pleurodeles waltl TaxID=8319 RepID=A0AAV7LMF4_PLEWA|nr:hypothetical protein NDU88_005310 [Pleurodeles waltl]